MPDYEYEYEYEYDLDRRQGEFESAVHGLKPEPFEIPGEEEYFGEEEFLGEEEFFGESEAAEAEELELELAAELLEVTNEEELDRFLGNVFKKVGGFVSGAVKSPVFKALGSVIKPIAKAALPIAGGALGTFVGGPAGAMIGSKLGSAAGNLLGLELEALSAEDREFEVAKRIVRLASGAAEEVRRMRYRPRQNPYYLAKLATMRAGRRYLRPMRFQRARRRVAPARWIAPPTRWIAPPEPLVAPPDDSAAGPAPDDSSDIPPEDAGDVASELEPSIGSRRGTWLRRGRRIILIGM
jgi:hypothetical protein